MSEYQYYEFQAIDRPLTAKEQQEIKALSSRAQVTPTQATFLYHYGDFRGNAEKGGSWPPIHILPRGLMEFLSLREDLLSSLVLLR